MTEPTSISQSVYVYEKLVRLWHSLNALVIVALTVTGYLIASPLASVGGEASDHFVMGYVRFLHFAAGYLLAIGLLFRAYWAYAGNEHARQIFMPPLLSRDFWQGVGHEILWYAFLVKEPKKYIGHNPLAVLFMHFVFVWGIVFMIITGFSAIRRRHRAGQLATCTVQQLGAAYFRRQPKPAQLASLDYVADCMFCAGSYLCRGARG